MTAITSIEDVERLEREAGGWVPPCASTYEFLCGAAARHPRATLTFVPVHAQAGDSDAPGDRDVACRDDTVVPRPDLTWTIPQFVQRATQAGNLFRRMGVGRRDVVSLLVDEPDRMHAALWGAQMVGIAHPIDPATGWVTALELMATARTTVLVLSAAVATEELLAIARERIPTLRARLVVGAAAPGAASRSLPFDELVDRQSILPDSAIAAPRSEDVAVLLQTAGSCSRPKLARLTHGNLVHAATALAAVAPLDATSVMLCGMPSSHVSGLVVNMLLPVHVGSRLVVLGGGFRDPRVRERIWPLASRHRATALFATPALLSSLVEAPPCGADLGTLRHVFCGGAGIAPSLLRRVEATTGARVVVGYGLTEGSCVSTVVPAGTPAGAVPSRSVGLRLPFQALRCARLEPASGRWEEVPFGVTGRVQVRGPNVFAGYVGEDGASTTLPGGWLDTGDLGSVDAKGHLQLVGRDKDVILRAGRKLASSRIEDALAAHPDVVSVAVVPRPDPAEGEVPVAYAVLRDGATGTSDALFAHCHIALRDPHALPAFVRVVPELPCTPLGKIDRPALRRAEAARAVREFLRTAGVSANVRPEAADPEADRLVVDHIPRGRRPTVVRVMEDFSLPWRQAGESPAGRSASGAEASGAA